MDYFKPPYSKLHIILLGSITLLLSLGLLSILEGFDANDPKKVGPLKVVIASADSIKKDFKEPLSVAQQGNYDTAWANTGFLIIDIRPTSQYNTAHIEGALSAPLDQLKFSVFGEDTKLVIYSDSKQDIDKALQILSGRSLKSAHTLHDSLDALAQKGYSITKSEN